MLSRSFVKINKMDIKYYKPLLLNFKEQFSGKRNANVVEELIFFKYFSFVEIGKKPQNLNS